MRIAGIGTVSVNTASGVKHIASVHYVLKVSQNLLSVRQLAENKYALLFRGRQCTVFDPCGSKMFTLEMHNNYYPLNLADTDQVALYSESDILDL